ncbi:cysteine hydrolase family protein [Alicyclobacillus macrosporangiidus]|uniref:cysteine hydrolase family protein n=1 Tax=Alicyclobacillus macrosporangiidus TaxID=392015 RepID=UPI000497A28D|nr:isochorismatase family cysteine hydrolase [Alicyclobacillus macrosporangiidus]
MGNRAVIAIDLHRGHLDPEVATMPLPPDKCETVIRANAAFFAKCRERGIPIVHVVTQYRHNKEILVNPAWRARADDPQATRKNVGRHNLRGMPGVQVIPALWDDKDVLVDTKKRYDCFVGTDLEFVLRTLGIEELWVTGVNTNSCVLATSIDASCRDYDVTIVSDCVDTMDGPEFHTSALQIFERAFGRVKRSIELIH